VHRIAVHVLTVHGADSVALTSLPFAVVRVIRSAQLLEAANDVLLADLESDAGTTNKLIDCLLKVAHSTAI